MNTKILISNVLAKYSSTDAIYPLRKYSANLKGGDPKKCPRVTELIYCALFDSNDSPNLQELSREMKKLKDLQDTEIFLFIYALTRQIFINLYLDKMDLQNALHLLSEIDDFDMESFYGSLSEVNRILLRQNPHSYRESDDDTKEKIRKRIYKYAKKHKISEIEAARIYSPEKSKGTSVAGKIFFPLLFSLFVLSLIAVFFIFGFFPMLFLAIPVFEALRGILLYFTSRAVDPGFIPRLKKDTVPKNAKTAVVVTSLIDTDNLPRLLQNIEDIYTWSR